MLHRLTGLVAVALVFGCTESGDPNGPDGNATVVTQVTVTATAGTLNALGLTTVLTATAKNAGGGVVSGVTVSWTTSDGSIATVSNAGVVTAVKNGSATITATISNVQGTVTITVAQTVASVGITPGTDVAFDAVGDTETLVATARDSRNNPVAGIVFSWSTSNGAVATVTAGLVTAVANGSATITATAQGGLTGTKPVTVAQAVNAVVITPGTLPAFDALTASADLNASARDANNNTVTGATITWASSSPGVATVNTNGLVTAVSNGTTRITAASAGKLDTVNVTVSQVADNVVVTCPGVGALTTWGATRQCSAVIRDRLNQTMSGAVTWASNSTGVAVVSGTGLVSARNNGSVTISATHAAKSGSQAITVDLKINYGTPVTGTILGSELHEYDITGGGTTTHWVAWVHRNPYGTSGLNDPDMLVVNSNFSRGGVVAGRHSATSEVLARAFYPNNLALSYLGVRGDNGTTGAYAMGISECALGATMNPGSYSWGLTAAQSCAFMNGAGGSTPNFTAASIWPINLTAGVAATIEVVVGCNPGAAANLSCTAPGGNLVDPYIYLFGPNNAQVWSDDDGAGSFGSRIDINPPTTGIYSLVITAHTAGQMGVHTICTFASCASNAGAPPAGVSAYTAISPALVRQPESSRVITVEEAYALLESRGLLPAGFNWRRIQPIKD